MTFRRLGLCLALLAAAIASPAAAAAARPNILILIADDLGARDLGVYGSTFDETPALDRLAASGMRFTQAYAAGSVCSPTRASLWTGRTPARTGLTDFLPGQRPAGTLLEILDPARALAESEVTLAEALRESGYQTFYAGKWHLGSGAGAPHAHGYEVAMPEPSRVAPTERSGRIVDEALAFVGARDPTRPFFAVVSFYEPHTPIVRYPGHFARFEAKAVALGPAPAPIAEHDARTRARQDDPAYASEVAGLDDQVGRVLDALARDGLADRTIVVFLSDNGGFSTAAEVGPTSNAPLRAGKGWLYEGGIRIPLLIRAPGVTAPGTTSDAPVLTTDLYPTLLALAGLPARPAQHLDGVSLAPLLQAEGAPAPRDLFWHYPHYHGSKWRPGSAVRVGDWKLVAFYEDERVELYDLADDPGERHDRAREQPEKLAELRARLARFVAETGAVIPKRVSAPAQ